MQSNPSTPDRTRGIPAILFGTLGILYFIILAAIITYIWVFAQDRFVTSASYKIIRQNPGSGESGFAQLGLTGNARRMGHRDYFARCLDVPLQIEL